MKLQKKYGFYLLYGFLTVFYLIAIFSLPQAWRSKAVSFLIFSDHAAMGLFFMGGVVLLKKSQKLPCAFAASPLRAAEYIVSKVISLGTIGMTAAALPAAAGNVSHSFAGERIRGIKTDGQRGDSRMELRVDRLTKQYGSKFAVDRMDFTMKAGVYGLLGANGAWKTTLMRMICDILRPTSGEILYDGRPIGIVRPDEGRIV